MQNHRFFWVAVVRFGAFPILRAEKSFLKLRSDWAGCRFPPNFGQTLPVGSAWRASWAPAAPVGLRIGPGLLRSRRAALASHSCQAWAITPRAPSAVIACAPQRGANRIKHAAFSEASRSFEVSMAAVRSKVGRLQPGCPRIALASCPARRYAQTNRPPVRAQTMSGISQTAGAFCSSGGEGSWPALGGQLACS